MINIKLIFECDECGEIIECKSEKQDIYEDRTKIILPDGWMKFENRLLCPKHKVKKVSFVDGKEIRTFTLSTPV